MIIVAESGSTKTHWVVIQENEVVHTAESTGFNPNYYPSQVLEEAAAGLAKTISAQSVTEIFYYGSGCSSDRAKNTVRAAIRTQFPHASIAVEHDLFGAARALFGNGKGIACILGTGSSSCLFDDGKILAVIPSLGYLLADEGSGMDIGKRLLNAYFKRSFPPELLQEFEKKYPHTLENFIGDVYTHDKPNALIASFTPFAVDNRKHPFINDLVRGAFRNFFSEIILKYPEAEKYHLGFAGSVAYLFREELEEIASGYNMTMHRILRHPVDALVEYHM